jgi:type IV secretion system protein VirB10
MTTPTDVADPHESKISPDDPRLHLGRGRGRTLRAGPIVAIVVGVLGLVAVALIVALQPAPPADHSAQKAEPEPPSGPQQAAAIPDVVKNAQLPPPGPTQADRLALARAELADAGPPHQATTPPARPSHAGGGRDERGEQQMKAASAGLLFETHAPESPPAPTAHQASQLAQLPPQQQATPQQVPQGGPGSGPGLGGLAGLAGGLGLSTDSDPNRQDRKNSFVDQQGATKTTDTLVATVHHPASPYEVQAGTIIPAVLITAINSDLPGPVFGQVRENVYDSVSGNYLLIPQGSRLLATYDSMVVWGQERVLMCWNRLIFPNGDSINLQCMPAADLAGAAGLTDDVNEHWWRIIKGAAVASLLSAAATAAAGNTNSQGYAPTVPQQFAAGGASSISQVGGAITRRNMDIQPTITVRPGWSLNVMVTKDMILSPYSESPTLSVTR